MKEWIRVSKSNRCPICNHDTWCCVTGDGGAALCMRVHSDRAKQLKSGETGWIHKLDGSFVPAPVRKKQESPRKNIDFLSIMKAWHAKTKPEWIDMLSKQLGVTVDSLSVLRASWAGDYRAWAFPMRDGAGNVCGVRLRSEDGAKFAVTGSKQGIFVPAMPAQRRAYIVEGPTDCAAGISLGLYTIGRPSCSGGSAEIKQTVMRLGIKELVIIADNDGVGLSGASALAEVVPVPCCIATLPAKDIRGFLNSGGDAGSLNSIVSSMVWQNSR